MNVAYFGSPTISATLLQELLKNQNGFKVSLVITQPDKPAGKRLEIQPTEVKKIAEAYKLPLFDKDLNTNENELIKLLKLNNIDLCIIFAYGKIISKDLLSVPKYGFWNIHPSLLPLYRGPSPVTYTLLLGDKKTGISLIQLEEKMDAGPIIEQRETEIELEEDRNTLERRLTLIGSQLLIKNLKHLIINHEVDLKPQDDIFATYTRLIKKEDGYIALDLLQKALQNLPISIEDLPILVKTYFAKYKPDFKNNLQSGHIIYQFYRAMNPWPGIWTKVVMNSIEKRLKLTSISFSDNKLSLNAVQIEGKLPVSYKTFREAYNIFGDNT